MPGRLPLLLGSLTAVGPLSTDVYLPAFPATEAELGTDRGGAEGTLQSGLAASGSTLVGALAGGTPRPMAALMLFGVGGAIAAELARPRH